MVNRVTLLGKAGATPEVKYTSSGTAATTFYVSTTERRRTPDGDTYEHVEWHRVVLYGRLAENAGKFVSKGDTVYIEGRLRAAAWTDRQGEKRRTVEVIGSFFRKLGDAGAVERGDEPGKSSEPGKEDDGAGRMASGL